MKYRIVKTPAGKFKLQVQETPLAQWTDSGLHHNTLEEAKGAATVDRISRNATVNPEVVWEEYLQ